MTTQSGAAPIVRRTTRDDLPAGFWRRDPMHWPLPLTPIYADFAHGRHLPEGSRIAAGEFASLSSFGDFTAIDGYIYGGSLNAAEPPSADQVARFEQKVRDRHEATVLRRWRETTRTAVVEQLQRKLAVDLRALSDADLLAHIRGLSDDSAAYYGHHFTNHQVATRTLAPLALFCQDHLGVQGADFFALLAGFSGASSAPVARIEDVALAALQDEAAMAALEGPEPWMHPAVQALLAPYLQEFGHRALDFEFVTPTLAEQPERAVRFLREAIARHTAGQDGAVARVRRGNADAVAALRERLEEEHRAEFDRQLAAAQDVYAVRDDDISFVMMGDGLMRYALREAGRRFAERGALAAADLVLYLRRNELEDALAGGPPPDLGARAAARHAEREQQRGVEPPATFGAPFPFPAPPPLSQEARQVMAASAWYGGAMGFAMQRQEEPGAGELRGVGASRGSYTGPARIILSVAEFDRVQPGDVLVCRSTSPAWNLLFGRIGALVTDVGGMLSHPSIIAREFGVPAAVGTRTGTRTLRDGQMVEVDGAAGVVRWVG